MNAKRADRMIDYSNLDAGLGDVIREDLQRQERRSMTKAQRRQAERNRMTFDLPVELEQELTAVAEHLSVPVSQVAIWWMLRGREVSSVSDMAAARIRSRSMRYEFVLFSNEGDSKG